VDRLKTSHLPDLLGRRTRYTISMKILIADPHLEVQSALHLIVDRIPAVTSVSEAGSLVQLLAQCVQSCPDLILFDLDLVQPSRAHPQDLADLVIVLQRLCPRSQVVAMSSRFEAQQQALAAGTSGFISKTDPPDMVCSGIIRILENRSSTQI
jgi:DNA-binding NarL/FixJ family response regulator